MYCIIRVFSSLIYLRLGAFVIGLKDRPIFTGRTVKTSLLYPHLVLKYLFNMVYGKVS